MRYIQLKIVLCFVLFAFIPAKIFAQIDQKINLSFPSSVIAGEMVDPVVNLSLRSAPALLIALAAT